MNDSLSVGAKYKKIAQEDENAAGLLAESGLYNQAAYLYIQAMEKQIKSLIAERVDLTNAYFADEIRKTMGHSLERSIQFLIKILPFKDEFSRQQVETQIDYYGAVEPPVRQSQSHSSDGTEPL